MSTSEQYTIFSDEYFMQQALREAQKAFDADEVPIGAIVVVDNKIISRGHNQTEQLNDATAHAEMIALTAAAQYMGSKYLPDATLYVTIEPCLMCSGALFWSKIGRIVFGGKDVKNGYNHYFTDNPKEELSVTPFHPKTRLKYGILQEKCTTMMQLFFQQKR